MCNKYKKNVYKNGNVIERSFYLKRYEVEYFLMNE